ncbi:MAG: hypothetical protein A3I24_01700 [Candidatus Harrisonbacteria bacterium RIFCSPLOWO2_02_FULL_41_13b]|uniref:Uncharacterized protein n=1 Tax=Candidatus Harrisonbacteria bacterium RIFCSPLOWO2_02_FULL_41_13b TaxID=1798409 RepID=A0A1G1ZV15_9BACT|nr:MAG: hypothetical protein A3J53_01120 [Candidatus Harrisonbacteria bacterium RIFCSPHIGHO2_02_FULL_40_20]OGY68319.1 MAG: hypothetical protein A3I24_01700 [Candidatus Harrisonbacteria bacterium RIFCSPLOWO2_02_FULL_41_13b]
MSKTNRRKPPVEKYEEPGERETPMTTPVNADPVVQEVVVAPVAAPITPPAARAATPYLDTLVCPLCGERKFPYQLMGSKCYRRYSEEARVSLGKGKFLFLNVWFKETAAPLALRAAEKAYKEAVETHASIQNAASTKAFEAVKEAAGGHYVQQHIFRAAKQDKQQELWKEMGGNRSHFNLKMMERAVQMLTGIVNGTIDPTPIPRPKEEATKSDQTPAETPMVQSAGN